MCHAPDKEAVEMVRLANRARVEHEAAGFVTCGGTDGDCWCLEEAVDAARQSGGRIKQIRLEKGVFPVWGYLYTNPSDGTKSASIDRAILTAGDQMVEYLKQMRNGCSLNIDFTPLSIQGQGMGRTVIQGGLTVISGTTVFKDLTLVPHVAMFTWGHGSLDVYLGSYRGSLISIRPNSTALDSIAH